MFLGFSFSFFFQHATLHQTRAGLEGGDSSGVEIVRTDGNTGPVRETFQVRITFDEDVENLSLQDFQIMGGVPVSTLVPLPRRENAYTLDVYPNLNANRVAIRVRYVGESGVLEAQLSVPVDRVAPIATLVSQRPQSGTPPASSFLVRISFDEPVAGLTREEIEILGGRATGTVPFPSSFRRFYQVRVTPEEGVRSVVLALGQGVAQDAAGNGNRASEILTIPLGGEGPGLTVATTPRRVWVNASSQRLSGTCEEGTPVAFSGSGLAGGTASAVPCSGGTYSAEVDLSSGDGAKRISVSQSPTNGSPSSSSLLLYFDASPPTVRLQRLGRGPAGGGPFDVAIAFSEVVTGFLLSEVSVTGGTARGTFDLSSAEYQIRVVPDQGGDSVEVRVAGAVAEDASGNGNTPAAPLVVSLDTRGPELTVTSPGVDQRVVNMRNQTILGRCETTGSEVSLSVDGGPSRRVSCQNGTYSGPVVLSSGDGDKEVTVSQGDRSGNTSSVSVTLRLDESAPTVRLSRSGTGPIRGPFDVTIAFSEEVTGLLPREVSVTGGLAQGQFPTVGREYTLRITPNANAESVVVAVGASVAQDAAGNENTAATSLTVSVAPADTTGPDLTVTSPAANARVVNALSQTIAGGCEAGGTDVSFSVDGGTSVTTSCGSNGAYSPGGVSVCRRWKQNRGGLPRGRKWKHVPCVGGVHP